MSDFSSGRGFRAALVQLCSGRSVDKNVDDALALIREAAAGGAQYVQTPEVTTLMELETAKLFAAVEPEEGNTALQRFRDLAAELKIWLHIGSMPVKVAPDKIANRAYVLTPEGSVAATYDKIHMFDVDLPGGESYRESKNYRAGDRAVVAALPWGGLGLSICYDLRFPHLYRALAKSGAQFLAVPAAFTKVTGEAHWHTLLRARAIECQCFVFAAAQGGRHEHGRDTYGHSLIISPWGQILAEGGVQPGVIFADIELQAIEDARKRVPSLGHDRPFTVESRSGP
ncbi:MAG: carbon-nitrogen hydrolase family protein [Hyphomicrobium sp.]|jgi:deaminated glutathione amidase